VVRAQLYTDIYISTIFICMHTYPPIRPLSYIFFLQGIHLAPVVRAQLATASSAGLLYLYLRPCTRFVLSAAPRFYICALTISASIKYNCIERSSQVVARYQREGGHVTKKQRHLFANANFASALLSRLERSLASRISKVSSKVIRMHTYTLQSFLCRAFFYRGYTWRL